MKLSYLLLPLACLLAQPAGAVELITNGDFEWPLDTGWISGMSGSGASITRGTSHDEDPDYEVYLRKPTGSGHVRVSQTVSVPGTDATFSARLKMNASATMTAWAASALILTYQDAGGQALGETRYVVRSQHCPWQSSPTLHIVLPDPGVWTDIAFTLDEELPNLPGIDPMLVQQVEVALYGLVEDC